MKNKFIYISKHIHASFAYYATGDEFLIMTSTLKKLDFNIELNATIASKKFPGLNGEVIHEIGGDSKIVTIYLKSDETFYNKGLYAQKSGQGLFDDSYSNTPEFKALVETYINKGFRIERDNPEKDAFNKRESEKYKKALKKKGVVLYMGYEEYVGHPELFQGGFSYEVFNSPKLKAYVSKGSAYGWIGDASVRTAAHDKQIEAGLRKRGISSDRMYNWISSGDGRHFADSLDGLSKKEQKEKIENKLNYAYNCCVIFGCSTHTGMASSSSRLNEIFGNIGILLGGNEKYNHKKHMDILISARKSLSKKETLTSEDEYALEILGEVFANKI